MPVKKKRTPAARSFYCSKCAKKRKMPLMSESSFWGVTTKIYQCPHCGKEKLLRT
jgi:predicted RNA-binding Zn-ribbon protein involved in translation (DUF1610 family)